MSSNYTNAAGDTRQSRTAKLKDRLIGAPQLMPWGHAMWRPERRGFGGAQVIRIDHDRRVLIAGSEPPTGWLRERLLIDGVAASGTHGSHARHSQAIVGPVRVQR